MNRTSSCRWEPLPDGYFSEVAWGTQLIGLNLSFLSSISGRPTEALISSDSLITVIDSY